MSGANYPTPTKAPTMVLDDALVHQGERLFRWRSFWPVLYLGLGALALPEAARVADWLGPRGDDALALAGLAIALLGLSIRWATIGRVPKGTSGRNTKKQVADTLNVSGLYSVTRNPLYLGNAIALFGVLVSTGVWWLAVTVLLVQAFCLERIIAVEERFLRGKFGARFADYAEATPIFLPDLRVWRPETRARWRPWALPFSARNVLRREFYGVLAVVSAIVGWDLLLDVVWRGVPLGDWIAIDWMLVSVWLGAAALFVVLRTLKKRTSLLAVAGR